METKTLSSRNCSIDIFRYVSAIMVLSIHSALLTDVSYISGYIFTQILTRLGVPFFFAVSGYFYIQKLDKGQKPLTAFIKRLLIPYSLWSIIYFAADYIKNRPDSFNGFLIKCIRNFFFTGSYYHLWFIPAIIVAACLVTLMYKIKLKKMIIPLSLVLYAIGCIGCAYYSIGINIPILNHLYELSFFNIIRRIFLMGFPFFVCGNLIYKINSKVNKNISDKKLFFLAVLSAFIWLAEIILVIKLHLLSNIIITFGLYPMLIFVFLLLLRHPLTHLHKTADMCRTLAGFTYYSHPFFLFLLSYIDKSLLSATPRFFIVLIITFLLGLLIYKINSKRLNKILL